MKPLTKEEAWKLEVAFGIMLFVIFAFAAVYYMANNLEFNRPEEKPVMIAGMNGVQEQGVCTFMEIVAGNETAGLGAERTWTFPVTLMLPIEGYSNYTDDASPGQQFIISNFGVYRLFSKELTRYLDAKNITKRPYHTSCSLRSSFNFLIGEMEGQYVREVQLTHNTEPFDCFAYDGQMYDCNFQEKQYLLGLHKQLIIEMMKGGDVLETK